MESSKDNSTAKHNFPSHSHHGEYQLQAKKTDNNENEVPEMANNLSPGSINSEQTSLEEILSIIENLQGEIQALNAKSNSQSIEIQDLKNTQAIQEAEIQKLNNRVLEVESTILEERTDKTSEYVPGAIQPQHQEIQSRFLHLRDNKFREIADKIFEKSPHFDDNNRDEIVDKIVSILAEEILVKPMKKIVNISELPSIQDITGSIKNQLKETQLMTKDFPDKKFFIFPGEIATDLKNLIQDGYDLIEDMRKAEPQGDFLWDERGKEFEPEKHELRYGKAGIITEIFFPGYTAGNKCKVKAWISTSYPN